MARARELAGDPAVPVATLAALLADDDWAVRAVATDALASRGDAALVPLRAIVSEPDHVGAAAALETLLALGDDKWLAEHVLSRAQPMSR